MELTNVFERAAMNKYRFPYKGQISVEDLWDLSLPGLDSVFKQLNKLKKANEEESLLEVKSAADVELEDKIAIVKFIVKYKQDAAFARLTEKENKEYNQKIMAIIEKKQDQALENMSVEELQKHLR